MKITCILSAIFIALFQGCLYTESTPSNSDTEKPNPSDTLAIDTLPNDSSLDSLSDTNAASFWPKPILGLKSYQILNNWDSATGIFHYQDSENCVGVVVRIQINDGMSMAFPYGIAGDTLLLANYLPGTDPQALTNDTAVVCQIPQSLRIHEQIYCFEDSTMSFQHVKWVKNFYRPDWPCNLTLDPLSPIEF